jgi:hypothetical protein
MTPELKDVFLFGFNDGIHSKILLLKGAVLDFAREG